MHCLVANKGTARDRFERIPTRKTPARTLWLCKPKEMITQSFSWNCDQFADTPTLCFSCDSDQFARTEGFFCGNLHEQCDGFSPSHSCFSHTLRYLFAKLSPLSFHIAEHLAERTIDLEIDRLKGGHLHTAIHHGKGS